MLVQNLVSGERTELGPGDFPVYSPTGHLMYQSARRTYELWAAPFTLDTLQFTGQAFRVADESRYPTIAADGTLVYLDAQGSGQEQLVWLDRRGVKTGNVGLEFEDISVIRLSPDERSVALAATDGANWDVYVHEMSRGSTHRVSTAEQVDGMPVWSPDGEHLAFGSTRSGNWDIFQRRADGTGEEEALVATPDGESPRDWSRDDQYLLYQRGSPETGPDVWYLERTEDGSGWEPHPFLQDPADQRVPRFSPNGRYVAYVSNESGRDEVYVDSFPERSRRRTVSSNGGTGPVWSRDGKELFYINGSGMLVSVEVSIEGEFTTGQAVPLFEDPGNRARSLPGSDQAPYDVSEDGQRFLVAEVVEGEAAQPQIRVVQNWYEEFRGRDGTE